MEKEPADVRNVRSRPVRNVDDDTRLTDYLRLKEPWRYENE